MNKIEYALRLAKDCTYSDKMMDSAKEHLRNVIDESLKEVLPQTDVVRGASLANQLMEDKWWCPNVKITDMKLTNFEWYRNLLGGTWEKYSWHTPLKKKKQSEWRKVHNGKWVEYKEHV